jgi:hypothetical protein
LRTGKMDDNFLRKTHATSRRKTRIFLVRHEVPIFSRMSRRLTLFARWTFEEKFLSDFQVGQPACAKPPWRA